MNTAEATTLVVSIGGLLAAFLVPVYLNRRKERQTARAIAARNAARVAENSEVSWEAINKAIALERDKAKAELAQQSASHTVEIQSMRERHQQEINALRSKWETDAAEMRRGLDAEASAMKQRYDEEMSSLSTRLAECQKQVSRLYGELYELQKLLPPGIAHARPASPPG